MQLKLTLKKLSLKKYFKKSNVVSWTGSDKIEQSLEYKRMLEWAVQHEP